MRRLLIASHTALLAMLVTLVSVAPAFANATVILFNADAPGVGLNDPTPAAPVAGNTGTTVGAQRLIALQHAADIWGSNLDSPVPIVIYVSFGTRTCTPTGAVLASAGAWSIFADFPGEVAPNTWHHGALADKRIGVDIDPGQPDLIAIFNINLGAPTCLAGSTWYYGLDANEPAPQIDLVAVALHEFGHGLGFSQFASVSTGAEIEGLTDVYALHLLDTSTFKTWDQMTDAERAASAINSRRLVWEGTEVNAATPSVLSPGTPVLNLASPPSIAGTMQVGTASFGPALTAAGVAGSIVAALDDANPAGPTTLDACTPITNAAEIAGKIALVNRGTCGFIVKAANVQLAGAVAMIVADNVAGSPPAGLGGVDPAITIPSVRISLADGTTIRAALASSTVTGNLTLDLSLLAGADAAGRIFMNAPNPVVPGSSVSHWDPLTFRNQLMEPAINSDLTHSLNSPEDLTMALMRDIGWYPDSDIDGVPNDLDECADSDLRATIFIDTTDSGVANRFVGTGCTANDVITDTMEAATGPSDFALDLKLIFDAWSRAGLITPEEHRTLRTVVSRWLLSKPVLQPKRQY